MTERQCKFNAEILNKTTSVIHNFIKEKEIKLRERMEELDSIPPRYVVTNVIKKEATVLSEEIDSMKQLINDLKTCAE